MAKPLYELTKPGRPFQFDDKCMNAFNALKRALSNPPVLAMPTDEGQMILDVDSSGFSIGGVLSQM